MYITLMTHHNKPNTSLVDHLRETLLDQLDVLNFDEDQKRKVPYVWGSGAGLHLEMEEQDSS